MTKRAQIRWFKREHRRRFRHIARSRLREQRTLPEKRSHIPINPEWDNPYF